MVANMLDARMKFSHVFFQIAIRFNKDAALRASDWVGFFSMSNLYVRGQVIRRDKQATDFAFFSWYNTINL